MANEIKIAEGTVGVTNYINTEVADNEYPVMGSGILAALASAGGGGFTIKATYDSDAGAYVTDKTWAEVLAAYADGDRVFTLVVPDSGSGDPFVGPASPVLSDGNPSYIAWGGMIPDLYNEYDDHVNVQLFQAVMYNEGFMFTSANTLFLTNVPE